MKIVFAEPQTGNVFQKEVEPSKESQLLGKKIGDKVDGSIAGLEGYELEITGGTDKSGFPMREDIVGQRRVKAFLSGGTGIRHIKRGAREKRQVVGGTVGETIAQLNAKIVKAGAKKLDELGFVLASAEERKKKKEEKASASAAPKARKK